MRPLPLFAIGLQLLVRTTLHSTFQSATKTHGTEASAFFAALQENEDEVRKQDLMMEIERIKALEQYEAREQQRHVERARGAKVLQEQIDMRERERLRTEELRDQERILMIKEIERLKEAELQVAIEKRLQAREVMEQVASANAEQLTRKELTKIREREEDAKIADYIRAKELKEQVGRSYGGVGGGPYAQQLLVIPSCLRRCIITSQH